MRAALIIRPDIRGATIMGTESVSMVPMDRSEAATTLLLWQIQGERDLPAGPDRTLVTLVDEASQGRPLPPPPRTYQRPAIDDLLRLDEQRRLEDLRARLGALAGVLQPEEYEDLRARLGPDLLPMGKILAIGQVLDRFAVRKARESVQRDFEAVVVPARSTGLRAVMLFSRDGRLLAAEGEAKGFDLRALSALVARGEPGSTWSLAHRAGFLVGHGGSRAVLVALFGERAPKNVPLALKASVASLEQRRGLLDASPRPVNQASLEEFLRAVRLLLAIETT